MSLNFPNHAIEYADIVSDLYQLTYEIDGMDDHTLVEEISFALENHEDQDISNLVADFYLNGNLNCDSISKLRAFYLLVYSYWHWEV